MRFGPVEFAGLNQGRDDGPVLCASIMPREERVFAVERNWTDRPLDGVVLEFDATVVEEPAQPVPVFGNLFQSLSGRGFSRDTGAVLGEPDPEGIDNGF